MPSKGLIVITEAALDALQFLWACSCLSPVAAAAAVLHAASSSTAVDADVIL